ncbi:Mss4-like protein [Xylogone sp. PMI_703]|nr:Mss4-like protein [Xylogone sp. PMI_703]
MSTQGGCFCGNARISFTGKPAAIALCHCKDCKKIGGANWSSNAVIQEENFKLEKGDLKKISTTGLTGNEITSHFCPDCGTTLFRTGASFPQQVILKTGVIDDTEWQDKNLANVEFFSGLRPDWVPAVEGAVQFKDMVNKI